MQTFGVRGKEGAVASTGPSVPGIPAEFNRSDEWRSLMAQHGAMIPAVAWELLLATWNILPHGRRQSWVNGMYLEDEGSGRGMGWPF